MTPTELERFLDDKLQELVRDLRTTSALRDMVRDEQQAANQPATMRRQHLRLLQGGAS